MKVQYGVSHAAFFMIKKHYQKSLGTFFCFLRQLRKNNSIFAKRIKNKLENYLFVSTMKKTYTKLNIK